MSEAKFIIGGAAVTGLLLYILYKRGFVSQAAEAINPLNNDNVINKAFTSAYQSITGSQGTLGTDIYDATHDGALDITSTNNAAYSAVNDIGKSLTGDTNWSLGTAIYDWTHP